VTIGDSTHRSSEWIRTEVPHLRIVPDELWSAAKEGQVQARRAIASTGKLGAANRPRYLFSGLTKCGVCGAGFIIGSANRLMCFGARDQGTCSNRLTIRRDEVERRVLHALQDKLLRQDLFEEFCEEFTREMNRLRMEHRASLSSAERELERVRAGIRKIIYEIKDGFAGPELQAEMDELQARKESLLAQLATADAPVALLHPNLAALYREKVTTLASALQNAESRSEAAEALRGLVDAIILVPAGNELRIELKGNHAAMLCAAQNAKRSPETGDLSLQVSMVAGARLRLYRKLCWVAA
jgi:site-specific DNA recombinase